MSVWGGVGGETAEKSMSVGAGASSSPCQSQPPPSFRRTSAFGRASPLIDFVGSSPSALDGTSSVQQLFAEEKAILTTRVCLEHASRHWFRWVDAHAQRTSGSACTEGSTPTTPRGARTTLVTGTHGRWMDVGSMLDHAGISVPCASLQPQFLRRHDYCLPAARFAHASADAAVWRRGFALVANELHTENFHHFNRDMLFFARVLARGTLRETDVSHVILVDASELTEWAVEHARAVLGPTLAHRVLVMPHRRTGKPPPRKAQLSNVTVMMAAASGVLQPPTLAPKYTCFDATVEKLVTDPVDRDDLSWLRRRAYLHCGLDEFQRPDVLLLILRGDVSLGDRATTARQVENAAELKRASSTYAAGVGLRFMITSFGGMSYCQQVALAARSRILIGVHGQGITNGQFMQDDGLVVELFHGGAHPHWSLFDYVGHQPLYHGAGRPYVAAALAESTCEMMRWKHAPSCRSYVNTTMVIDVMRSALAQLRRVSAPGSATKHS